MNIIIFGSCVKGRISKGSDIDLCVILEPINKRQVIRDILLEIEYENDLDIVAYTP